MSKSHVGMGYSICPVCGEKHDQVVLLDRALRDTLEHEQCMGVALCPTHRNLFHEGYIALIEVRNRPVGNSLEQLQTADRTGKACHLRRAVWSQLFDGAVPDGAMAFVGEGTIDALERVMAQAEAQAHAEGGGHVH